MCFSFKSCNPLLFLFRTFSSLLKKRFLLPAIIVMITACKKESIFPDVNIIPPDKRLQSLYYDSLEIELTGVLTYPMQTSSPLANPDFFKTMVGDPQTVTYSVIGSMKDPVFGLCNASFLVEPSQSSFPASFGTHPVADSVFLRFTFDAVTGDTNAMHTFHVYQLSRSYPADTDSVYLSSLRPEGSYFPTDLAHGYTASLAPFRTLSIPLDTSLGNHLLGADSATMSTVSSFLAFFKGLYVNTDSVSSGGSLGVFRFSSLSLDVIYHNNENASFQTFSYKFASTVSEEASGTKGLHNLNCITMFSHNYGNTPVLSSLSTGERAFIHGPNGVAARIVFKDLASLRTKIKAPYSLHQAILVIKTDSTLLASSLYRFPSKLLFAAIDENGQYRKIEETTPGIFSATLSSTYSSLYGEYTINITRYINDYLKSSQQYTEFILLPFVINYNAYGREISSGLFMPAGTAIKKPVLKIYYNTF